MRQIIDEAYKLPPTSRIEREELDISTGLGVLPLSTIKGDKYYLIEGKDTRFRIYHETDPRHKIINISSVAHDKPSLVEFAEKLADGGKAEQELAGIIRDTIIARIEAAEQRRVKAEQAALRLAMWKASAPVYNTRTRGKKVDYSEFGKDSDDEEEEENRGRRSERNRGEREVAEYTASGRMVKRPRMNGVESRMKDEPEESEEEMEWSVYSDKGETDKEEEEEEGEDEEYDIRGGSLVVILRVSKEGLRAVTSGVRPSMNGKFSSPGIIEAVSPTRLQQSPGFSTKPYQQQLQYHSYHQSPPRPYPTNTLPIQNIGPTPYTGGSPPIPFRATQLAPQPIPCPPPPHSPQNLSHPQAYHQSQIPPHRPIPQPTLYPIAQSPPTQPTEIAPYPYRPPNGIHRTSPPSGSQSTPPRLLPQPTPYNQNVTPLSVIQPALKPMMWRKAESPAQPTWSTATFQPPTVNGTSEQKSEIIPESKLLLSEDIPRPTNEVSGPLSETEIPLEGQERKVVNGSEILNGQVKDGDPKSLGT